MLDEFIQFIESQQLIQKEESVLLAVSGGMDSMCMATLFQESDFEFAIAHLNHGMRGIESDKDEKLVRGFATKNNIKFFATKLDLSNITSNFQSIARKKRRDWLTQIAIENGYQKIATAHHEGDQVENFFIRINRNAGLKGLRGMQPLTENLIKPLLFTNRKSIEKFVSENDIPFREDASNQSIKYDRNFIRNKVIPTIEERYPEFSQNVISTITKIDEAYDTLQGYILEVEYKCISNVKGRIHIDLEKLSELKNQSFVLYTILSKYGLNRTQSDNLLQSSTGAIIQSEELFFLKNRNQIIIGRRESKQKEDIIRIDKNSRVALSGKLYIQTLSIDKINKEVQCDRIFIDEDAVKWPLSIRKRNSGDIFYPSGMKMKSKKLKKFFIDLKLNKFEKENVRLLVDANDKIIWVIGYRQDERSLANKSSKRICKIQVELIDE